MASPMVTHIELFLINLDIYVESATISTKTTLSSSDIEAVVDAATVNTVTTISASEVYTPAGGGTAYIESAIIATTTNVSAVEDHVISDAATVTTLTTLTALERGPNAETATITTITVPIGGDTDIPTSFTDPQGFWGVLDDDNGIIP